MPPENHQPSQPSQPFQPFARRIVLAFTLMTFLVSGVFSLGFVFAVRYVEKELVSRSLKKTLNRAIKDEWLQGKTPRLDHDMLLFAATPNENMGAIPESFSQVRQGFSEIGHDWVFSREINGVRYVLVQDQYEFEVRERLLFAVIFLGFLLSVVGAWLLGRLTARRVMFPVARLAEQVRSRNPFPYPAPPLKDGYADDEIGHLAEAFDDAMRRLGQALERERLFTADVSHELRTPLMVISTSCELLEQAEFPPREREHCDRIARAAKEMQDMAQTFLLLARSAPPAQENNASLVEIASEEQARWEPEIRARGLTFTLVEEAPDMGQYNAILLRAVMGNLLRNALHYTEQGWIRLTLEDGGFRVEDSGAGVPEQEKELIFQAFTRGEQARGEGLGLGLSLVKRICAHQGWHIELNTLPEGGCSFRTALRDL